MSHSYCSDENTIVYIGMCVSVLLMAVRDYRCNGGDEHHGTRSAQRRENFPTIGGAASEVKESLYTFHNLIARLQLTSDEDPLKGALCDVNSDEGADDSAQFGANEGNEEENDTNETRSPRQQLLLDILSRCSHFVASPSLSQQVSRTEEHMAHLSCASMWDIIGVAPCNCASFAFSITLLQI